MVSGISQIDSEWWKTPRVIYGKVPGSFGKFQVKPRKSGIFQKWVEPASSGPAPPQVSRTRAGQWAWLSRVGEGASLLPPLELERERSPSSPLLPVCSSATHIRIIGVRFGLDKRPTRFAKPMASRRLSQYIRDHGDTSKHTRP
jgi:hypothetical protein